MGRLTSPALAMLAPVILISCSKEPPPSEPALRPVRAEQVFSTGGSRVRKFAGVAQASVESKISFRVGGTVQNVAVVVGNKVRRGQLIAELDPEDYRLRVQDAEAALAQSEAQERNAKVNYERVRGLYESRNASKQDLDSARAQHESAAAGVRSNRQRLELERNQLGYTRLAAPIAGSVAAVNVEINENVQAGQTVVLLTSGSDLEVRVSIPGVLINQVKEGEPVSVKFDALPGKEISGQITKVGVAATEMATTYPVTVRLDSADLAIRSGMAAEVTFTFVSPGESDRILVPLVALGEDRDGKFVFVVEPGGEPGVGIVKRKSVSIGQLSDVGITVLDGLVDGEHVVTAGVSKLVDGQRVRFQLPEER
jgi:RND family efflux transporter MFP subunit